MFIYVLKNILFSVFYNLKLTKKCYSLDNVIKKYSLQKISTDSINNYDIKKLVEKDLDIIISIASPEIFKKEILEIPKYGSINYHTALLPKYRGRQPLFWALYNNEKTTGITIHTMDEYIDKGEIIVQESIEILPEDSLHDLYLKTITVGPRLLYEAIQDLINGNKKFVNIQNTKEKLYPFPKSIDGMQFRKNGNKFI